MRRVFLRLTLCVALTGCATPLVGNPLSPLQPAAAKARQHLAEGHLGLAVKEFGNALAQDPRSVKDLNGLAASYDRLGRYNLARRHYLEALEIEPYSAQTLNNLGYSYYLQGRYEVSLPYFIEASVTAPSGAKVIANRDLVLEALEEQWQRQRPLPEPPTRQNPDEQQARRHRSDPGRVRIESIKPQERRMIIRPDTVTSARPEPRVEEASRLLERDRQAPDPSRGEVIESPTAAFLPSYIETQMLLCICDPGLGAPRPVFGRPAPDTLFRIETNHADGSRMTFRARGSTDLRPALFDLGPTIFHRIGSSS